MSDELFSYRLRRYRETNGVSQDQLGAALGVTARYIGMIERGDKEVEPTSAIYKLFTLIEKNKVPMEGHPEEVSPNRHDGSTKAIGLADMLAQARADLDIVERGNPGDKRRALAFLKEVHLPMIARALKLDL